jgi:hemoglobin-like flavoprotein
MQWAERARHARGSNQHTKAVSYFLASARASATGVAAARRAADAARFAQEGLASLSAAEASQVAMQPRQSITNRGSGDDLPSLGGGSSPPAKSAAAGARPLDTLRAELMAVLDNVRRVQASWALVEPAMDTHGVALMLDFFRRCPDALPLFSFGGMALDDPAAAPKMRKHAITLMSTVGTCVAGLRDFEAMIPTLISVGRMHYNFGDNLRSYFPPMGQALLSTLRAALGADFTADVEAAWQATYEVISLHIFDGIDRAERAAQEQSSLRGQLMGTL